MKRLAVYFVLATLGMALVASSPAAARHCYRHYSGYYGYPYGYTSYPYWWANPSRYAAWNNWYNPYSYSAPYRYSAWNYGWGAPIAGSASLAAAPFELAGAAVAAPFAVAANAEAPLMTGRSVAVGRPYYARRMHETRHAHYVGHIKSQMHNGRSAYIHRER